MIKKLLPAFLLFAFSFVNAETIKTDVLVIGGGACGVAAAIQSARSKVKTLLVEPGPWLGGSMTMGGMCVLDANRDLPSGIWGEFRRKVTDYYRPRLGYDTSKTAILRFEPSVGAEILRKITDTVKNLTVKMKTPWTNIKKNGSEWEVTIVENGENVTVKAKVVIDGTETGEVAAKAGVKFEDGEEEAINWVAILKDFGKNADKTIAKPDGYNQAEFAFLKNKDARQWLRSCRIPNDKFMVRPGGAISGNNYDELIKTARLRTLGLVYYLQNEFGYRNIGLDDEFGTPDHLAPVPLIERSRPVVTDVRMVMDDITKPYDRESKLYRTSIGVGSGINIPAFSIPLGAIVPKETDNLLVTEKAISVTTEVNRSTMNPAVQMTLGQGIGATAAYCAFFKTTTKHLTVRIIQGEILDFKGYLIPFTDVSQNDLHWRAIQQIGATGILKGIQKKEGGAVAIHFEPNDTVRTAEVKPIFNEIYTRAFLWFNNQKPGEYITLGNLLYFISDYTLTDPATLEPQIRHAWKTQLHLPGELDVKRPATRLEFAMLVNKYLNPFGKRVDLTGKVMN
ncbi:MAG TPA: FAD-dependent oxidoreductase [Mucilaginibacter sp.]|nr:FAD-dependent oxidoreductase [Mucilaginibacter sp.]